MKFEDRFNEMQVQVRQLQTELNEAKDSIRELTADVLDRPTLATFHAALLTKASTGDMKNSVRKLEVVTQSHQTIGSDFS